MMYTAEAHLELASLRIPSIVGDSGCLFPHARSRAHSGHQLPSLRPRLTILFGSALHSCPLGATPAEPDVTVHEAVCEALSAPGLRQRLHVFDCAADCAATGRTPSATHHIAVRGIPRGVVQTALPFQQRAAILVNRGQALATFRGCECSGIFEGVTHSRCRSRHEPPIPAFRYPTAFDLTLRIRGRRARTLTRREYHGETALRPLRGTGSLRRWYRRAPRSRADEAHPVYTDLNSAISDQRSSGRISRRAGGEFGWCDLELLELRALFRDRRRGWFERIELDPRRRQVGVGCAQHSSAMAGQQHLIGFRGRLPVR